MARLTVESIAAPDEFRIEASFHEPFARASFDAVAVVNSGAAIPKALYESFASWLADNGVATVTYDYRGVGGSRGKSIRGLDVSIQDWGSKDCAAILNAVTSRYAGAKLHVVGHSIGGIVTGFVRNPPAIDRMVLVSPHTGSWRDYARPARRRMYWQWHVLMPGITRLVGYFPGRLLGFPEDLPYGVAMEWASGRDGARGRRAWFTGAAGLAGRQRLQRLQRVGAEGFARFDASVLTIRPSDDPFATPEGLDRVASLYSNCAFRDLRIDVAPGERALGHFGFFRAASRERLWPIVLEWLKSGQCPRAVAHRR